VIPLLPRTRLADSDCAGFDFGIAGTCTAFPAFQQKFGEPYASQASGYLIPARVQSGWNGASAGGEIIGVLIAGLLLDWMGRKHTMIIGAVCTAVGVGLQQAASSWQLFLVGRLVNGNYLAFSSVLTVAAIGFGTVFLECPVWIGETVRPELRGFFLCLMNGSIVFGQFLLS
jgi:MFS family permease